MNIVEKTLIRNCQKAMLDGVDSLDNKTLKRELKKHLQEKFELEDKIDKAEEEIISIMKKCLEVGVPNDIVHGFHTIWDILRS